MQLTAKVLLDALREDARRDELVADMLDDVALDVVKGMRDGLREGQGQFDVADKDKDTAKVRKLKKAFDMVIAYMGGKEQ